MIEDEMVGWHHWLNGHKFEQTLGDGEGQGSLTYCSSWGCRVWHDSATEQLITDNSKYKIRYRLLGLFTRFQECISWALLYHPSRRILINNQISGWYEACAIPYQLCSFWQSHICLLIFFSCLLTLSIYLIRVSLSISSLSKAPFFFLLSSFCPL